MEYTENNKYQKLLTKQCAIIADSVLNDMKNNTQNNFNHLKQIQKQFREQMYG